MLPLTTWTCADCGPLPTNHVHHWIQECIEFFFRVLPFHGRTSSWGEQWVDRLFLFLKLATLDPNPLRKDISLRTTIFTDEAEKHGMRFAAIKTRFGTYNNNFSMWMGKRRYFFEGLPRAPHAFRCPIDIDDKWAVKRHLARQGFPHAEGRTFSWLHKQAAIRYGEQLGYPLIVKPRAGSMSHHITPDIRDHATLVAAVDRACAYGPFFIMERFLPGCRVYRATTIDGEFVACVERIPAHVIGDGTHTVDELIAIKNQDPRRGGPKEKQTTCYKIILDARALERLAEQKLTLSSTPSNGQRVWLQDKVILDLGADLAEVTLTVHADNRALFTRVAAAFPTAILGIDFLCEDITRAYTEQRAAIIELNSLPYIDMHHFPTTGTPVNVAAKVVEMVKKYYQ
ncbi:hypothetical protein HY629_01065 [Candidatus Uhrbacteria bacterium]|nr:hypothetical protein [Candidatus Uhrbacteria bacterium]